MKNMVQRAGGRALAATLTVVTVLLAGGSSAPGPDDLVFDGMLRPERVVVLRSSADGILADVTVERGDRVEAGQVVAELEFAVERADTALAKARAESRADLEGAVADLDFRKRELQRMEALRDEGVVEENLLDEIRLAHRLAEIRVSQEEERLAIATLEYERALARERLRSVVSPIDGVVLERMRSAGEMVTRSVDSPIVRIAQIDPLDVDVRVPVEMLRRLDRGGRARVFGAFLPAEGHVVTIRTIDPVADAASDTVGVRLQLPNPDHAIPAGVRCRVEFEAR